VIAIAASAVLQAAAGCGPMVERPRFPSRPDSIRPADLLGPYDGKVIDGETDRPIAGATVAASWAFERGIGVPGPADAEEVVVQTGADGRYVIPQLDRLPTGLSARVRRFTLIIYQRGFVAWRSDRRFPGTTPRRDFSQRGNVARLDRWQPAFTHAQHLLFMGGGAKIREVAAWEAQQASLDLEGETGGGRMSADGEETRATAVLDIGALLTDDEIRGVTGYVGSFEKEKLSDLPTTEFYDSRHFKAVNKPESFDVGLRVWRLGVAAAEAQYQKLRRELPKADVTDEIGDASFRARSGDIGGLVFLVRDRGVVVSLTCGSGQCTDPAQLATIGKLVESRLSDLPPAPPLPAAPGDEAPAPGPAHAPAEAKP